MRLRLREEVAPGRYVWSRQQLRHYRFQPRIRGAPRFSRRRPGRVLGLIQSARDIKETAGQGFATRRHSTTQYLFDAVIALINGSARCISNQNSHLVNLGKGALMKALWLLWLFSQRCRCATSEN